MFNHKVYVVCSYSNIRNIDVDDVYDGKLYTINNILAIMKKKLQGQNIQTSIVGDNAFIDVIDNNGYLLKTYSIISKQVMLTKEENK